MKRPTTEQRLADLRRAVAHDRLDDAITAYGRTRNSFWAAIRTQLPADEAQAAQAKFHPQAEAARKANRANALRDTIPYYERPADLIEDAEFLAKHRVLPADAAKRLGFGKVTALEKRLSREGRWDIFQALTNNDPLWYTEDHARRAA